MWKESTLNSSEQNIEIDFIILCETQNQRKTLPQTIKQGKTQVKQRYAEGYKEDMRTFVVISKQFTGRTGRQTERQTN